MRRLAGTVSATSLVALFVALPAWGQGGAVSDADREAARNLYKEGFALQAAGNYAEALDRFRRSQQVYPAPTALLHVAECEAKLGRLVEAAETYRTLSHTPLEPNAPPPFVAAQQQGAAELQQIEPRIPHVRIDVTPQNAPGLTVTIDGQPMSVALLGVERPIDPGEHTVVASAPGLERGEAKVTVAEKEATATVALALKPLPILAGAAPLGGPRVIYVPAPGSMYPQPTYYAPRPVPLRLPAPVVVAPAGPPESRSGIYAGARLGAVYPYAGGVLGNDVETGFTLGAEVDLRFARRLLIGAVVDHGFLETASSAQTPGASFSTTGFDAVFGVVTNPDHLAALFQFGVGYRTLSGSDGTSLNSPEAVLDVGMWIPIGHSFRLVPRVDTTFGSLSGSDAMGNGLTAGYAMVNFLVGGYFNHDFH